MFHGGLWGGWQYQVTAQVRFDTLFCLMSSFLSLFGVVLVHVSTKFREFCQTPESFTFGYGGYQEARGSGISDGKNNYYIENDLALLDSPSEWYLHINTQFRPSCVWEVHFALMLAGAGTTTRRRGRCISTRTQQNPWPVQRLSRRCWIQLCRSMARATSPSPASRFEFCLYRACT